MVEAPVCRRIGVSGWTRDDLLLLHIGLVVGLFSARARLVHRHHLLISPLGSGEFDSSAASKHDVRP